MLPNERLAKAMGLSVYNVNTERSIVVIDPPLYGSCIFDPVKNGMHFAAVLSWLLAYEERTETIDTWVNPVKYFEVLGSAVRFRALKCDDPETIWRIEHDGTPEGLMLAIRDAAVRVLVSKES